MRLSKNEVQAILESVHKLDPKASVYLYGSRTDDQKRGGDIDLLIFSDTLNEKDLTPIRWKLYEKIGEQKIDMTLAKDLSDPFVRLVLEKAVRL